MMNREDQGEAVSGDDGERQRLLATLGEYCRKTGWLAAAPFLPRRAICNLENLPGGPELPLALEDASWGAQGSNLGLFIAPEEPGGCVRRHVCSCGSRSLNRFWPESLAQS